MWSAASLALGVLTLIRVYYTKKQVDLIWQESDTKKKWTAKHAEAFALVSKTHKWLAFDGSQQLGYSVVFSDAALVQLMETYLVCMNRAQNTLSSRVLDGDHYCFPIVQETIQRTIEAVERFRKERPREAANLGLLTAKAELDFGEIVGAYAKLRLRTTFSQFSRTPTIRRICAVTAHNSQLGWLVRTGKQLRIVQFDWW